MRDRRLMGAVGILVWVLLLLTAGCSSTGTKGYYEMRREREKFFDGNLPLRERRERKMEEIADSRWEIAKQ